MRKQFPDFVNAGRHIEGKYRSKPGDPYGLFDIRHPVTGSKFRVMVGWDDEWEHVSVSKSHRCPTWDEMCWVKWLFWHDDETVVQYHVPAADHINCHPFCLHLWRNRKRGFPMPPKQYV